jgi:hypothetical protein
VRGVFDIETEHWDTFVVGGMYDFDSGYVEDWQEASFADRLFAASGDWYAHNGGKFDFLWLLQEAERRGVKSTPIVAGQRIVKLTIDSAESETPLVFLDSAAVWPMSLERFTGGKKKRTALPCVCEEVSHCGGYCSIARGMPGDLRARLSEYLRADVVELHAAITTFLGYASSKGLDIKTTIGASAWKFAARFAELPNAEWESIEYKFVRDAYYGGRTEVYKTRSDFGYAYDINSAYPAALTDLELPTGTRREVTGRNAAAEIDGPREGIARVRLQIPEMHSPPLPKKNKHGRVCYPIGLVAGTWTLSEIRHALSCGATVEHVDKAIVWESKERIVSAATSYLWALRDEASRMKPPGEITRFVNEHGIEIVGSPPGKDPLVDWLKLYANSLTGKFAQNPELEQFRICDESDLGTDAFCRDRRECFGYQNCARGKRSKNDRCCRCRCSGLCGRFAPFGIANHRFWLKRYYRIGQCAHIHWAAHLTAWTRIKLHKALQSAGLSAVYCDTDSIYRESRMRDDIGSKLGQWKEECGGAGYYYFTALSPKVYSYIDGSTGEVVAKCKGVPNAARNFDHLSSGVRINRGVDSFRTAAKNSALFRRKDMTRIITAPTEVVGSREIVGRDTRPLHWSECEELK